MPTINSSEFSISAAGDIRSISGSTTYSVLDLHTWLQDLADNAAPIGDDSVSILGDNPSELAGKRFTNRPMALTLLPNYNIDDTTAQRFYFGSIEQNSGNTLYTGVKSIGSIVASSPVYIVQNNAKATKFWPNGHIQILLKAKTGGTLIDSGNITVFSRKYGQTYSHFDANLSAGGEQQAALSTSIDSNITLTEASAQSILSTISITIGDTTQDLGGGQGPKLHKGTITLNGSTTLLQAYHALMYACSENSTATVNAVPGWRYRTLNAAYTENIAAPFGTFAGGKWFVAQGWWLTGVMASESKNYQLTSHDGTIETPPNVIAVSVTGVASGDYVVVGRDNGSGNINTTEYTVSATAGATAVTVTGLKVDTPASGVIRINGNRHTYTSWTGTTVSGLSPAVPGGGYTSVSAFIPLIDTTATGTSVTSATFQYSADFNCVYKVRNGSAPIVPFQSTLQVTSTGGSGTAVRTLEQ